ncbi:MAG: response regulator [Chloroflexi bacterium]|nr:response regulator [Chloroflexota bacterium]
MNDKARILVVDDDTGFLQVAGSILRAKGYEADTAASGDEAVSRIKEHFCNVAILDISLPDIAGTELLSTLLNINPDILAIMLTGHSSVQNAVQSLNRGAFAYLEKPLDPEQLLSVINRGLEKQRLVLENRRLVEELKQRNRETSILLSVSQSVAQSLDLPQILDLALKEVAHSLDVDASYVCLGENSHLTLEGYYGFTESVAQEMKHIEVDHAALSYIFQQTEPVIIEKIADSGEPFLASLSRGGYQSCAGIPLMMAGERLGVMGLATRSERSFSPGEVELLEAIGREIAIAVRNAQLYEEASSAKALRELDALRTEILANVSHELRTPLAAIKGFASSLLQPDVSFDEPTWQSFVQTIDSEADKLNGLIEELLMMSRLEARVLEVKKEPHNLADILESVRGRLVNVTVRHRLQIAVPRDLPEVAIDGARIGEVITNLVENAVKCSTEGTEITVTADTNNDEQVVVSVSDEGIGIPAELHQKIFDRFYQVSNPVAERKSGAGLGLCICRGIVEAHGGRMWLESEPGIGSKFSFSIPSV